jgi:hypothetical protein
MTRNRNLVVLRCGDQSLHPGWIGPDRNWDLAVSYFGSQDDRQFPEANFTHRFKGGKWNGIFAFFQTYPETLEQYDFFWLPDDDIEASCQRIETMFQTVKTYGFELAQPSLSHGSYLSHLLALNNPYFVYRRVNFIELMVPVLSRKLLIKTLPLFEGTRTGFGMDYVWHRFTTDPTQKVAILDNVAVKHTRPVGGALHKMLRAEGLDPAQQELAIFLEPYGDPGTSEAILGGLLSTGLRIRSPLIARLIAAVGWSSRPIGNLDFANSVQVWRCLERIARNFLKTTLKPPILKPIEPIVPLKTSPVSDPVREFPVRRLAER